MSAHDVELAQLVGKVARRYARLCWWADEAELRQVAWASALRAREEYVPGRGSVGGFFRLRVQRAVSHWLLLQGTPLSAPDNARGRHGVRGVTRAPLDAPEAARLEAAEGDAEEQLTRAERADGIRRALEAALGARGYATLEELLEARPRGRAREERETVLVMLRGDPALRKLWEDR